MKWLINQNRKNSEFIKTNQPVCFEMSKILANVKIYFGGMIRISVAGYLSLILRIDWWIYFNFIK